MGQRRPPDRRQCAALDCAAEDEDAAAMASDEETDPEQRSPEAEAELWRKHVEARARAWGRCREIFFFSTTLAFASSTVYLTYLLTTCRCEEDFVCGTTNWWVSA